MESFRERQATVSNEERANLFWTDRGQAQALKRRLRRTTDLKKNIGGASRYLEVLREKIRHGRWDVHPECSDDAPLTPPGSATAPRM